MRHESFPAPEAFEFRVVPAPRKGERVPGLKTDEARMANTLTDVLNQMATDGWDYVRADQLPNDTSTDLTGTAPKTMVLLVFRRPLPSERPRARRRPDPLVLTDPLMG